MSISNRWFAVAALSLIAGAALMWFPLAFVAAASVALVLSIVTARDED